MPEVVAMDAIDAVDLVTCQKYSIFVAQLESA